MGALFRIAKNSSGLSQNKNKIVQSFSQTGGLIRSRNVAALEIGRETIRAFRVRRLTIIFAHTIQIKSE